MDLWQTGFNYKWSCCHWQLTLYPVTATCLTLTSVAANCRQARLLMLLSPLETRKLAYHNFELC